VADWVRRLESVMPRPKLLAAGLVSGLAVGLTAAKQGGYFASSWGWSGLGLLLAAALALGFRDRLELDRLAVAYLAGLVALLLWIALSTVWSATQPSTVDEVERTIVYAAGVAALVALATPKSVPYLLGGVLTSIGAVCAYSLVDRLAQSSDAARLSGPLGYWNALGILCGMGLLIAGGLVFSNRLPAVRLAAAASVPLLVGALYLTHSRGAILALGAGAFAAAFLHPSVQGGRRRAAASALLAVALVALVVGIVRAGGPGALLGRTVGAFNAAAAAEGKPNRSLLTLSGNNRSDYWRIAWRQYRGHPWLGTGSGTFNFYWDRDRDTIYGSRDAHNLYLETLAELGPVGLLLLVGTLLLPFVGLLSSRPDALRAAAAGAYLAFLLHAGIDWDWEMPAVTLAGLFCGGSLAIRPQSATRTLAGAARAGAFVALAIVAGFTAVAYRGNSAIDRSIEARAQGKLGQAEDAARLAARWNPWSSEAWQLLGEAQLAAGDDPAARRSFRAGLRRDAREWKLWYDLALASRGGARRRALTEATRLNRYSLEVLALRNEVFRPDR
jgi:O-Antigen ligase